LGITSFIALLLKLYLPPPPPEAPYPAAHRADLISHTLQFKVLVPEVFGLID